MTKARTLNKDNTPSAPLILADAPIVNNPAEGAPDYDTLPTFNPKTSLLPPAAVTKRTVTLGSGTVRSDH